MQVSGFTETPVIVIVYRRPELTRGLLEVLSARKPQRLLIVADGPRPGEARVCAEVRRVLETIDWPCQVEQTVARHNLGCRLRVQSGLDWAFERVDRAIILEDDIHPHPAFFEWAGLHLHTAAGRADVAMLCGHNPLIRWPTHWSAISSRRGGVWGWATWADRWQAQRSQPQPAEPAGRPEQAFAGLEPALAAMYRVYLEAFQRQPELSWDVEWTLRMALSRRVALVSPVNLIHHLGHGPDATHTTDGDPMLFTLPRPADALNPVPGIPPEGHDDAVFDRARVLLELLVRTRDPAMARRLARRPNLPLSAPARLHLLPFRDARETRQWLTHLHREGADPAACARWSQALGDPLVVVEE